MLCTTVMHQPLEHQLNKLNRHEPKEVEEEQTNLLSLNFLLELVAS